MNAQELVTLASAHGVDFLHVAGAMNKPDGIAGKRRTRWVEIEPGITELSRKRQRIEAPDTAKGKGSRVAKAATYSHAELGIAAQGVSALAWCATQHSIANDRTPLTIRILHAGLTAHASRYAKQFDWEVTFPGHVERDPKTGRRVPGSLRKPVFYREALCMLVLDEISFRAAFTEAPGLFAIYLGIEQQTWERTLLERFKLLQNRYACWYGAGLREIQLRINGEGRDEGRAA